MPGDGDSAVRADNAEQLGHPGFEVGPHRHISYRDHAVDAVLDRRLGGVSIEALAAEQGKPVPSAS